MPGGKDDFYPGQVIRKYILVFLCLFIWGGCSRSKNNLKTEIQFDPGGRPEAITIYGVANSQHEIESDLKIFLDKEDNYIPIIGRIEFRGKNFEFFPIVPFTPGKSYRIVMQERVLGRFTVPMPENYKGTRLENIYPSADTVPENLLKMYFVFSDPMSIDKSSKSISVLSQEGDTLKNIFLELDPELWDEDQMVLTLWLDPGRVKRGLIPNEKYGAPLEKGSTYYIIVDKSWRDKNGNPLGSNVEKKIVVGARDESSPDPLLWQMEIPGANTRDPLIIKFGETLDYILAQQSIHLLDNSGKEISVLKKLLTQEMGIQYIPDADWKQGEYIIDIEKRLEDMAGNNLTRLFDRDILKDSLIHSTNNRITVRIL